MWKAELTTICTWILEAWQELDPQIIVKSFKKCTISNTMDATEDHVVWEEDDFTASSADNTTEVEDNNLDLYYHNEEDEENTPLSVLNI